MKKTYLNVGSGYAMKFMHRAPGVDSQGGGNDTNKSPELIAIEKIDKQVEDFKGALGDKADKEAFTKLEEELKALKEGLETLTSKEISASIESINKENAKIHKQLVELQEANAESRETPNKSANRVEALFSQKAVKDFVEATFKGSEKTSSPAKIELKAAETFGYATFFQGGAAGTTIDAFTGRYIDPTLYFRKRKRNLILDNFNIQTINVPKLIYLIKVEEGDTNPVSGDPGGAAWILSGQAKPKRSFRVTTGESEAKKVAIFGTVEDKLLRDVSSLENWIREDFMDEMRETINDGLLNNNPAVNPLAPLGLKTNAIQYVSSPAYDNTIEDPNYIDMIIAAIARMRFLKEEPGMAFISSDVFYRIMHLKATDGKWLNNNLVYINNLGELYIAGVHVIDADEEDVPSTHLLLVGRDLGFKIYAYGNMVFERGLNGTDFREDKTSYRGYQEFLTFIPENRENSVLYDTFVNIEAAIVAAA